MSKTTRTLTLDQWLDQFDEAFFTNKQIKSEQIRGQLSNAGLGAQLFHRVGSKGLDAFRKGHLALAHCYMGWLESIAGSDWNAQLLLAELRQELLGSALATGSFKAHIKANPIFRYQIGVGENPIKCAVLLSADSSQLAFEGGGFSLSDGLTATQHLIRGTNLSAAMVFAEGLREATVLDEFDVMVNAVSDADVYDETLRNLQGLLSDCKRPVVNLPEHLLRNTRDQVYEAIREATHFIAPRTLRVELDSNLHKELASIIERHHLTYPLLLRPVGTQTGVGLVRIDTYDQLAELSLRPGWHYLTEFYDFRSADGYYRKYRCWSVGNAIMPNHVFVDTTWNVHGSARYTTMKSNPHLLQEDKDFSERKYPIDAERIEAMMATLRQATELDYFGVDFGINEDGVPVFFEANPTMLSGDEQKMYDTLPHSLDTEKRHVAAFHALLQDKISKHRRASN